MRMPSIAALVIALAPHGVSAQRFEVASVKANRSGDLAINVNLPAPDRFTAANIPLRDLIRFAFDVPDARLQGGPDWIRSERFDVTAKAERDLGTWGPAGPPAAVLAMVRALLTERFALSVHRETKTLPVFALVRARPERAGPELRRSSLDCDTPATCGLRMGPGQIVSSGTPISQLAVALTPFVQRIVIDKTELNGAFDIHLSWASALPPVDSNGPSIFTALKEQLGLELEPQQAPLDVVVIDRVDRPTPD